MTSRPVTAFLVGGALAFGSACLAPRSQALPAPLTPLDQRFADQPGDAEVNYECGWRAELTSDYERAEQYYRRALALKPEPALRRKVGHRLLVALTRGHRYQEAYLACKQRLVEEPGDRPARYLLAAILSALDRPREAELELEALLRTGPDDAGAYLALGKLYRDDFHDRPRADRMFRRYVQLAPQGPEADSLRFDLEEHAVEAAAAAPPEATPTAPAAATAPAPPTPPPATATVVPTPPPTPLR